MTLDAVGGVWRYAVDLAAALGQSGTRVLLVGSGPPPDEGRRAVCVATGVELLWTDLDLDWLCSGAAESGRDADELMRIAAVWKADLLHLNMPYQAAGLPPGHPIVVAAHSCLTTWWDAVYGSAMPKAWQWQHIRNADGLRRADVILAPSRSHASALQRAYGAHGELQVVHHATAVGDAVDEKELFVLSAGRWWDEGKNGDTLDEAAAWSPWPVVMAGPLQGPNGEQAALHHAQLPGELDSTEMAALMRRAAIFAAPSRYEPFGLAVLEAAAQGAALVLSDIPTFRELWEDCALFVPPDNARAFADAFAVLAVDIALRQRLGDHARRHATGLSVKRQLDGVMHAYQTAVRRQAGVASVSA